jgi:hypothetical protein
MVSHEQAKRFANVASAAPLARSGRAGVGGDAGRGSYAGSGGDHRDGPERADTL